MHLLIDDIFFLQCLEILEGLLKHGRLSLNQILDRHKDTSKEREGESLVYLYVS